MKKNLKNIEKNATMDSGDKTMTREQYIENQEKEVEQKINQQNQSLTKTEEIEIDEF